MNKTFRLVVLACLLCNALLFSQSFTRITDATNPVVNDQFESGGGSWADIDNDGYLDLFVPNGNLNNQNNSLYLNDRQGSFIKVVAGAVVSDGGSSIGGAWGDFNNDGMLDLFVTNRVAFGNFLYLGNGDSSFTKITAGSMISDRGNSNSSSWIDIENDGDLDLFVVNFGERDFLYRNNGAPDYAFTKVDTAAIVQGNSNSIRGAWADYDNDRDPDLFVGNAGAQNDFLYTNNGAGTFQRTTFADGRSTLGASWGDYDNDGDLDLFVANFLNQKNLLYTNSGPPDYSLTPVAAGAVTNDAGMSVGSAWGDFDNDGDLDLFVANNNQGSFLYQNNGAPGYTFTKITASEIVNNIGASFGCVWADYDRDGDLDLFVANQQNQKNFLFANDGNPNAWLTIKCVGAHSNTTAIGAKVRVKAIIDGRPRWQMQEALAQTGYNSQNLELHFGLGEAAIIDSIKVEWPSGVDDVFVNVGVKQFITITESGGITSVTHPAEVFADFILQPNYPNPFNPSTRIRFGLPSSHFVTLKVYDVLGREVAVLLEGFKSGGVHEVTFEAASLRSGLYLLRMAAGGFVKTHKMLLAY